MILFLLTMIQPPPVVTIPPVVAVPVVVAQPLPVARPWSMRYADVYRKVEAGREFKVVAGDDLPGTTRVDDLPGMGKKLVHEDGREFTVRPKVVYVCYLHKGVPSIKPEKDDDFDKPQPVRDAAKKVFRGAVELVTPPFSVLQQAVPCVGPT